MQKYMTHALVAIFLILVFCLNIGPWQGLLAYQEQLQMFLFSQEYLMERLSIPGGFLLWGAQGLVQLFYIPWLGAFIMSALTTLPAVLSWLLARQGGVRKRAFPLSFVPAIALLMAMGNENVLVSLPLGLGLALLTGLLLQRRNILLKTLALPFVYWLLGTMVYVVLLVWLLRLGKRKWAHGLLLLLVGLLCVVVPMMWLQYPVSAQFMGLTLFRFPSTMPFMVIATGLLAGLWWRIMACLPLKNRYALWAMDIAVVGLLGLSVSSVFHDRETLDLLTYDQLARQCRWDDIIKKAEQKRPTSPMGVAAVNLALAKRGELCDRLFEFYQRGSEGLFPSFRRDFTTPVLTAEVFWHLGLVNSAMRYVFEAQEAIPNHSRSARMTRRLAECHIVNGNLAVARKYLRLLSKTLFYSRWAKETLRLIDQPEAISRHPDYGRLRDERLDVDVFFSDVEIDQLSGMLFVKSKKNRMAYEYLVSYELLNGDLVKFMQYYPLGRYAGYDHIPRSLQEALVFCWTRNHRSFQGMPYSIDEDVVRRFVEGRYENSFWQYLSRIKQ